MKTPPRAMNEPVRKRRPEHLFEKIRLPKLQETVQGIRVAIPAEKYRSNRLPSGSNTAVVRLFGPADLPLELSSAPQIPGHSTAHRA
jgi:hypothetical protein